MILPLINLVACGGGGGGDDGTSTPALDTLAFVITDCREDADTVTVHQTLQIRRGEQAPVTVVQFDVPPIPTMGSGICHLFGSQQEGNLSVYVGAVQRLGVSRDATIVFEVTDDFSLLGTNFLAPEEEGFYVVHADSGGLRRLGPASRVPVGQFPRRNSFEPSPGFSPDGRRIVFRDRGPGLMGEDATQVVVLDLLTGERRQVTRLPPAANADPLVVVSAGFVDDRTIGFASRTNPDGLNPSEEVAFFTIGVDGRNLTRVQLVALPGSEFVPDFLITGGRRSAFGALLNGRLPVNPSPGSDIIREVWVTDSANLVQITNFGRADTAGVGPILSLDQRRVFFTASADPVGSNPTGTCQIFSADALGGDMRQVTDFQSANSYSCRTTRSRGCRVDFSIDAKSQDTRSGTLLFDSTCDPLGTGVAGSQIFAIEPDGSGLRQLTNTRGVIVDPDGSISVELPGPWVYGPHP